MAWNWSPLGSTLDDYDIGPGDPALAALQEGGRLSYVVNTIDDTDDGVCTPDHCSLREAINQSNTEFTYNDIRFDIAGPAPHVIKPTTPLPAITRDVLIDGTTQPDFTAGAPTIVLSGVDGPVTDGLTIDAVHSAIRGLVINGFGGAAIRMNASEGLITGNVIGTRADGSSAVRHPSGSADVGILISNASAHDQIGGVTGGDPNLIAGNDDGIIVGGQGSRIIGNLIGTDASGQPGVGNAGTGIRIEAGLGITVGGTDPGQANVISGSGADGVAIVDDSSLGNVVSGNSIHDNGGLGIDLGDDGVDPTPPAIVNPATGPNRFQARPAIDDVTGVTATGRVWGVAGPIRIEFFRSSACDPSGNGEGTRYLGSVDTTAVGTPPFALFSYTLPEALSGGDVLTATATSTAGTSEFSPCWPVSGGPGDPGDTPVGTNVVATPVDATTGASPVQVTFGTVTSAGVTSLVTSDTAPALPAGFVLGDPPTSFDISTTAVFDGEVGVCISYAGIAFIDPAVVRLYHYDDGLAAWVDATTSVDTGTQVVCGTVTSLSPFALVQPAPKFTTAAAATFSVGTNGSFTIATSGFLHPVLSVVGSLPAGISMIDHHDGTAVLGGTAATGAGGVYAISLNGQEAGLSVNQPFSLTVREAPAFVSPASTSFTLGAPGTFQVITRGYPVPTITRSGSLPAGLTLNTSTGVLSGTPATGSIGTYRVTLRATNGIGVAAQQALTITVGKRGSSVSAVCVPDPVVPGARPRAPRP